MALRQIQSDYKTLAKDPVEGFLCVPDESNFFVWTIYIEGPKDTPFEGGIFQLQMDFPKDYPMSPPALRFVSEFYHPNVYKDGKVCISILHPPGHDAMSGELPEERWLPTQTVTTIILSVLSILGDPNLSSPANVDASVCWRDDRKKFCSIATKLVEKAKHLIPADIQIPHPESNATEREAVIQKRKQELNRSDLFEEDGEDFELCAEFPDEDDDTAVFPDDEDPEVEQKEEAPKPKKTSHSKSSSKDSTKDKHKKSSSSTSTKAKTTVSSSGEHKKKRDASDKKESTDKKKESNHKIEKVHSEKKETEKKDKKEITKSDKKESKTSEKTKTEKTKSSDKPKTDKSKTDKKTEKK